MTALQVLQVLQAGIWLKRRLLARRVRPAFCPPCDECAPVCNGVIRTTTHTSRLASIVQQSIDRLPACIHPHERPPTPADARRKYPRGQLQPSPCKTGGYFITWGQNARSRRARNLPTGRSPLTALRASTLAGRCPPPLSLGGGPARRERARPLPRSPSCTAPTVRPSSAALAG